MLLITVSKIPAEGMTVNEDLSAAELNLEREESFVLRQGRLESAVERGDDDTVHVRGRLRARLALQCGRCLEEFMLSLDQELDLFYLPHQEDQAQEEEDEVELSDRDMVVSYYADDRLDLGETVREQFLLSMPMKRLCREDCKGLCATCGANLNLVADCGCAPEETTDPRLLPLKKLLGGGA